MTIIAFNRYWVIRWHWTLISLFAAGLLMSLSLWQLSRATEKKQTLVRIAQGQAAGALNTEQLLKLDATHVDGVQVRFAARWVAPMIWLLDNQLVNGRIGYDVVIAVEEVSSGPALLINLGWVAATNERDQLPAVHIPAELMVDGIFRTRTKGLLLGTNLEDKAEWPMRMQQLDAASLAPYVKELITSGAVFQQQQSPFLIHYQPVILPPERHNAYAVQWALLALAVIVVALAASSTKELTHD